MRIDHFRGFEAYWEVPAGAETADKRPLGRRAGRRFLRRPGREPWAASLPIIAEDLGVITPAVEELRDDVRPARHEGAAVRLERTGQRLPAARARAATAWSTPAPTTTTRPLGWWRHLADAATKDLVAEYVGYEVDEPHWTLIRLGMMSLRPHLHRHHAGRAGPGP